jgi:branched-subunit amino acid transport protein
MPHDAVLWPLLLMVVGALVTYFWRALGVALSGKLDVNSDWFEWTACVAYALLAGLIARMILIPIGPLADTAITDRVAGAVLAFALFFLFRRNMVVGVATGALVLVLLTLNRPFF